MHVKQGSFQVGYKGWKIGESLDKKVKKELGMNLPKVPFLPMLKLTLKR